MTAAAAGWALTDDTGPAASLHRRSADAVAPSPAGLARSVRLVTATDRCVVLGSTQPPDVIDEGRLAATGLSLTRRRSGGSAVVVGPGEVRWVDVVVPAGDELWDRDVGAGAWWIGDCWAAALRHVGARDVLAWRGPMVRSAWSSLVCFAGLGPGEVTVAGRKVLGVSQRRTSAGALFQCALLERWVPAELLEVCALPGAERRRAAADLEPVAVGLGSAAAGAVAAFLAHLPAGPQPSPGAGR